MNANKIQSVISSCLRRAQSSVAMGTAKSVLDQQRNHTYLSASFLVPSLTPFGFQPHLLPWNMQYLTTSIFLWRNDKGSPTQSSFTCKTNKQHWFVHWSPTLSIILGLMTPFLPWADLPKYIINYINSSHHILGAASNSWCCQSNRALDFSPVINTRWKLTILQHYTANVFSLREMLPTTRHLST